VPSVRRPTEPRTKKSKSGATKSDATASGTRHTSSLASTSSQGCEDATAFNIASSSYTTAFFAPIASTGVETPASNGAAVYDNGFHPFATFSHNETSSAESPVIYQFEYDEFLLGGGTPLDQYEAAAPLLSGNEVEPTPGVLSPSYDGVGQTTGQPPQVNGFSTFHPSPGYEGIPPPIIRVLARCLLTFLNPFLLKI